MCWYALGDLQLIIFVRNIELLQLVWFTALPYFLSQDVEGRMKILILEQSTCRLTHIVSVNSSCTHVLEDMTPETLLQQSASSKLLLALLFGHLMSQFLLVLGVSFEVFYFCLARSMMYLK